MKPKLLFLTILFAINSICNAQGLNNLPENPDPGKCYVKCITKNTFKEVTERVQSKPSYTTLKVIPATYKTVEERILVKEASKKMVYIPAVYETVDVPYIKEEKYNNLRVVPAVFGESSKVMEIYPKTSGWEYKVLEDCPSINKEDCMVACFVESPAQSKRVSFTTLTSDAKTVPVSIAEKRATYKKQVVKVPARVKEIPIPAEYKTIKRRVIDKPASAVTTTVPAEFKTITRTVLDKKGGVATWEKVECSLLFPTLLPIFYELGSARLTPDSKVVIDEKLLPILTDSNVSVEIMSHTDSRGNDDFNMSLSEQRARSVVNYLITKGISRGRLRSKGFGETRLINRCSNGIKCSETEHKKNRRTEFRIINSE